MSLALFALVLLKFLTKTMDSKESYLTVKSNYYPYETDKQNVNEEVLPSLTMTRLLRCRSGLSHAMLSSPRERCVTLTRAATKDV